ncbi:MAG: S8 family serine peptidase, partial [Defluviitaleaceae bacterium]|nr:S8 family serine peptidase [Defluviitaleaceae bacterium]
TDANILALKVDDSGALAMSYDDVAAAIRYAANTGCGVIDISVGTPNASDTLKDACDYAAGKGCIVIAAAGGTADTPYYPAAYDSVIGVDGLGADLKPLGSAANNSSVFVTAPGADIVTIDAQGGYKHDGAGASYAAAQVAALAAFAKQVHPDMTAAQFRTLLQQTVRNMSGGDYSPLYGWGVISCVAFTEALRSSK